MKEQKDIFISYRRAGGEWFAYCLYLELTAAGYTVFFDIASLRGGSFEKDIEEQVRACKDFIMVLPPDALKRCVEAEDLVYKEIKTARDSGKNMIPIMMKGFSFPSQEFFEEHQCPERYEDMKYIEGRNGHITDGILNLDGTILHLKKNLLCSVPNAVIRQEKTISLDKVFDGHKMSKHKSRPEYELLPNLSTNEYFAQGSRDKEIAWLSDAIERMQPAFVWGYGGVGKTELVMEFARYQSHYRNVSFVTFSNSVRETIINMKFVGYVMPDLDLLSRKEREVAEEKIYREKLKLLNAYSEEDILIVDNFEKPGKTLVDLKRENAYKDLVGIRMHVVFTTRNRPDKYTKELLPLSKEDLLKMTKHYLGDIRISENLLLQLIDAVDSNTMAVELIAKLMADEFSSITPQEILAAFAQGTVKQFDDTEIDSYKDREYRETTIFEHIKLLFNLAGLSGAEIDVLRHAFFISATGMKLDVFVEIGKGNCYYFASENGQSYAQIVKGLVNKGWLRIKNGKIFIHSLVKEVLWEEKRMKPDGNLKNYLTNFTAPQYNPIWYIDAGTMTIEDWKKAERMRAEYMTNAFRHFNNEEAGYAAGAAEAYRRCGDFEQSIIYTNYALDSILSKEKKEPRDWFTILSLERMWCQNMVESSWDPDCSYGNELYEDHSNKPENVQGIYRKIQALHNV